jgi:hypothetical protein
MSRFVTLLLAISSTTSAFVVPTTPHARTATRIRMVDSSPLPEIPGDYDWDEKYAGDAGWIVDPSAVPGKNVMVNADLAKQAVALATLEEKWRKERDDELDEDARNVGWVPKSEIINGRTAMFFIVVGLLTEYWTGYSFPQQVEEMLRVGGFISVGSFD